MLSREIAPLIEFRTADPRAPATEYRYADGSGQIGFIASVSRPFCLNCNRIRLTATATALLPVCDRRDGRESLLRRGARMKKIAVASAIRAGKWLGHEINSSQFVPPPRPMYSIGG